MQKSKSGKEEKAGIVNQDVQFLESKRLDSVKRNFAIGIDRLSITRTLNEGSTSFKNHVSKN